MSDWGQGAKNNNIGWGQGAVNNDISWGASHKVSWAGDTEIVGTDGDAPINTIAPVISGTALVGNTLTSTTGTWTSDTGVIGYLYQWYRGATLISGATNSTYVLTLSDAGFNMTCRVAATDTDGTSAYVSSNAINLPLLLDTYTNSAAAYSLRKLRTEYVGSAIRVRRASDNTEMNIGFVNNELNTATLETFCSGTNGFVTTWYDQSGDGYNLTQNSSLDQPKIYDTTTGILLDNSKPSINFNGSTNFFANNDFKLSPVPFTIFSVFKPLLNNRLQAIFDQSNGNTDGILYYLNNLNYFSYFYYPNINNIIISNNISLIQQLHSFVVDNGFQNLKINSVQEHNETTAITNNPTPVLPFVVGDDQVNNGRNFLGSMQEIIIYKSNQFANELGINDNINAYFNIY